MEKWRRAIPLVCICLAIFATKYAVLRPLVAVRSVDFSEERKAEARGTEEDRSLALLGREDDVAEKTSKEMRAVSGAAWERVYAAVAALDEGTEKSRTWTARVPADDLKYRLSRKTVFFRPDEDPLADISGSLRLEGDQVYPALETNGAIKYLEATLHVYSADDFHFGSGFTHYPKPPARLMFPFRKFGLFLLLAGLAAYIFLPRKKRDPQAISYETWRLILGDFVAFLLFTIIFAMPFFIVGGTVQAITHGWMFGLIFWPMSFLGLWLLPINAWYAGYRIHLREDGFLWESGGRLRDIPFSQIAAYRPLILASPRWLIRASAAAALSGKGTARIGASGRALMLAGSSYGGLGLTLKDGSGVYFWVTDALGTEAMRGAKRMVKLLEGAGIRAIEEPEVIRSVAVPIGRDTSGKILKQGNESLVWILAGLPVLTMVIFFLIVMFT